MIGKLITAATVIPALAFAPPADAQSRICLGGYLYPQYDQVSAMAGVPSYAYDLGASVAPGSDGEQVQYPAGPLQLLRYDAAVDVGVQNLDAMLLADLQTSDGTAPAARAANSEPVVIAGVSMGSIVIDHL